VNAPIPPTYSGSAFISNPHHLVRIPLYEVTSNKDDYRCFPVKSGLTVDKFITSMEVIPGNTAIVHHVLIFQDQANTCFELDAQDTAPGYTSFGGIGSQSAQLIGAWVPGSQPYVLPKGMGIKLNANANIVLQVHYAPGSVGKSDSTQLRLKFTEGNLREVRTSPILNHVFSLTNGPLFIPANTVKTFNAQFVMPNDATIISIAPHMHLIAKSMKSFAVTPSNDTIKLIKIDHWDFHWQGSYLFKKAIKLPRGTFLKSETVYDNTATNIHQPSNPPKDVSLGENTTDEMMLIYFSYTAYRAGDENMDLEEATTTGVFAPPLSITPLSCFPNPTAGNLTLRFSLEKQDKMNIQIFDYQGVMIKSVSTGESFMEGKNEKTFSVSDLPKGFYFVKINSDTVYGVQQFIKIE
jgi:Secretion system C-terminal sorting domain/Copper type II ascorbate-dependent monooxygenase, N-terminal domain/Copper type II ascorbate-dependent monooxygenase, C-terminal domain